ncbi:MAG: hypothetical protein AAGA77_23900 [Bacteroidota bacterium]
MALNNKDRAGNNNNLINPGTLFSFFIGIATGLFICFLISEDGDQVPNPSPIDITSNLITNAEATALINNFSGCSDDTTTVSGHIELPVLLEYLRQMGDQCQSVGRELSGLEYYFAKYNNDPDNGNRITALFYPTYRDSVLNHYVPFDPFSNLSVERMNTGLQRTIATDAINCVLDKSNMSPPRQPTF